MNFVPSKTFLFLMSAMMPSLERGFSESIRNRCFRSFFGTMPETLTGVWGLFYDLLKPSAFPLRFLWTFRFSKQHGAEESNSSVAGSNEATLRS